MVTAVRGAILRIIGLSSLVATTATDLAMLAPSVSSMNSRTSRPRSPTRAMTHLSKASARASMDSSVDLPTPEPAKTPSRCPRQRGEKMSMARTPVRKPRCTRSRVIEPGAAFMIERGVAPRASGAGAVDRLGQGVDRPPAPARVRRDGEGAAAEHAVADADRLSRLDRAHDDRFRLDADHLAEMHAPAALMGDEIAEMHMRGQAGDAVMAGRDGAHAAAMGELLVGLA